MKRRILAVLFAAVLVFSLTACTANNDEEAGTAASGTSGIDYDSTDIQELSDEKVEKAVLTEVAMEWLGGNTIFTPGLSEHATYTYGDFVEKIGVEATTYNKYDEGGKDWRAYTWIASDDETSKFAAYFEESEGEWLLRASGSVNL